MLIFSSPSRYVQGPGVLERLGSEIAHLGKNSLVVLDEGVRLRVLGSIEASHAAAGLKMRLAHFSGQVTQAAIDALCTQGPYFLPDVVVGVGGGKALYAAKAVSLHFGARFVSVPTIASSNAPSSSSAAIYNDAHELIEVRRMQRSPDLVLVDTSLIASAPLRFLRADIGDTIAKKFETEACLAAQATSVHQSRPSHTGLMAAQLCYELICRHAAKALLAIGAGQIDDDVEALLEATTLLNTISYENGGLSVAHAIARGITRVPRTHGSLHGERVAYGLLVQFSLEGRPATQTRELLDTYHALGLPQNLADLQLADLTEAEMQLLVEGAMGSPNMKNFVRTLTPDDLLKAIERVEAGLLSRH